jgi:hypothetical protein
MMPSIQRKEGEAKRTKTQKEKISLENLHGAIK